MREQTGDIRGIGSIESHRNVDAWHWFGVPPLGCDVPHWFGLPPDQCDVPHWLPYLEAEQIGMDPGRKITLPLPTTIPKVMS